MATRRSFRTAAAQVRDLSDLLAIAAGEAPLPHEADAAQQARAREARSQDMALTQTQPRLIEWLRWPIQDRAYQLWLRGYGMRAIGRELGCDKDTANGYVRAAKRDQEPLRRANREAWLRETIERLRNVQAHAWGQWDQTGEAQLLNTITVAEREIAKLRGLYDLLASDAGGSGVTIHISQARPTGADVEAAVEGAVEDESLLLTDGASDDDGDG